MEELHSQFPELPSLSHGTTNLALEMVEVNKHYHCTTAVLALRPHQVQMYNHWIIAYRDGINTYRSRAN